MWVSIYSGDKITKNRANTQKYLHISQKSSTFAGAFVIFVIVNCKALAIVAQLVEQRIRNAWVAGSSPASGSKRKKKASALFFFLCTPFYRTQPSPHLKLSDTILNYRRILEFGCNDNTLTFLISLCSNTYAKLMLI